MEFRRAKRGELGEIVDFINMVFSMEECPHQFRTLLPKLYENGALTERFHYICIENGKIKGVVCMLPIQLEYKGKQLKCGTVGSVAVHPDMREKGCMKQLMEMAIADMKEQGIEFSCLSGQRQRYAYYGYEKLGDSYYYSIQKANIIHSSKNFPVISLQLENSKEEELHELYRIYKSREIKIVREQEQFFSICKSWNGKMITIRNDKGIIGYLCVNHSQILECVLENEKYLFSVLAEYLKMKELQEVSIIVQPYEWKRQSILQEIAESCSLQAGVNYRIFDYKKVLEFYFEVKMEYDQLEEGTLAFIVKKIDGKEEMIEIQVKENQVSIFNFDYINAVDKEDKYILVSEKELMQIAFSNCPIWEGEKRYIQKYKGWFPLPLGITGQDLC